MSLGLPSSSPLADKQSGIASGPYQGWFQKVDNALILTGVVTAGNIIVSGGGNSASDGGAVPISGINQLTGDVTAGPGDGSQAATIAANAVTFAKTQQIATQMLVGRDTAGTGNEEQVTISTALDWLP